MQGKQAKIVSPAQEKAILGYVATTRLPGPSFWYENRCMPQVAQLTANNRA